MKKIHITKELDSPELYLLYLPLPFKTDYKALYREDITFSFISWDDFRENDKKMTLEFELNKMGSPIPTWTNKG